jgi:hypothetical protein
VANLGSRRRLPAAWTTGRQCSSWGCRGTVRRGEGCGGVSWPGGQRLVASDIKHHAEAEAADEGGCCVVLCVEE